MDESTDEASWRHCHSSRLVVLGFQTSLGERDSLLYSPTLVQTQLLGSCQGGIATPVGGIATPVGGIATWKAMI